MGRYAHVNDLLAQLQGLNLDVLSWTGEADSQAQRDLLLEAEIDEAESWAEGRANRVFVPLASRTEVINGLGSETIHVRDIPIFDVQQVSIRVDTLSPARIYSQSQLRLQRDRGVISVNPGVLGYFTMPIGVIGAAWFPRGVANILVQYRSGYAVIGDNIGLSALADESFPEVAHVTTDASFAYFDCPRAFALFNPGAALTTRPPLVMLKDGVDDSANWKMASTRRLKIAIGSYSASAKYVFAYVPAAIGQAVVKNAAAGVLKSKSFKDDRYSAGGVTRESAQGFSADYGDYQYAGHVKALEADAEDLLRPYVSLAIA